MTRGTDDDAAIAKRRPPGASATLQAIVAHRPRFRSISTRLVALVAMLIVITVTIVVWQWAATERALINAERRDAARGLAAAIGRLAMNEVDDANWAQIRVDLDLLMKDDPDIVYALIHADKADQRIVAATPEELGEQFIPDVVPLDVTRTATSTQSMISVESFLLRDITFRDDVRGRRGEPIVEVAVPIRIASGVKVGTARVGVSLAAVDSAVSAAVSKAVTIGGLSLVLALIGALLVARRLSQPLKRLADDAAKIASGDFGHRALVDRKDEIGELAGAFNEMSSDLEDSFGKLRQTLESFERFVPRKFLNVIAPEGIENIVVGTGAPRNVSVLFTDLRGFTSISEDLRPIDVFRLLNDYLARMGAAIDEAGGFVDKYIGDAIMALFDDEHTDGVLRAVIGMRAGLRAFNAERKTYGLPPIESGIGVHGGEVVMGTIGFANKIESTVIGDPVNVASRVEAMTKDHGVHVLVTGQIVARLRDRSAFPLRIVATGVSVRGRDEAIDLYTLDD